MDLLLDLLLLDLLLPLLPLLVALLLDLLLFSIFLLGSAPSLCSSGDVVFVSFS